MAPYDWLGHGMYFWENNYARALQWAEDKKRRGTIKKPAVIGAILYLGYCCDFMDAKHIRMLQNSYKAMVLAYSIAGKQLPKNKDLPHDRYQDKIIRELDCSVIEFMHQRILDQIRSDFSEEGFTRNIAFDSTRGIFTEGGPAFEGAGLFAKSHIQICIRNLNCIKGFFLPRGRVEFPMWWDENRPAA